MYHSSDSQLELSISCTNEESSLLVLLNVTSEGCPPLEQVRISFNDISLIGRPNDTFRFDGVTPGESYAVKVETQVEGEGFSLYEEIPDHVYSTPEGMWYYYLFYLLRIRIVEHFDFIFFTVPMTTNKTANKQSCKKLVHIV